MTANELKVLEILLEELEEAIIERGMPKSHLHNVRDLRRKTLSHFMNNRQEKS